MRSSLPLALPLLLAAAPALATGGFDCRTTDRSNIRIDGVLGHVIGNPLVGARLTLGSGTLSTMGERPQIAVGQSWFDARELRLDLTDRQATRFEARLRARMAAPGTATGTLTRAGRTHPVRCEVE